MLFSELGKIRIRVDRSCSILKRALHAHVHALRSMIDYLVDSENTNEHPEEEFKSNIPRHAGIAL